MEYFKGADKEQLEKLHIELTQRLKKYQGMNLDLNMARGKPCKEQIELSDGLIDGDIDFDIKSDYRNYGVLDGIVEVKNIYKDLLGVKPDEMIIAGNSSLNLMYDTISRAMLMGTVDSDRPWVKEDSVKFLCPVPGYDRHFSICEALGIEMINIPMDENGPDVELVKKLVKEDPAIKGMWCVPKYSNPSGVTYSDEVVKTLATMETAAKDFKLMWDDAYCVHHLYEEEDTILDILQLCKDAGNANRVYMFTSTSKITFPGGGISMMAAAKENADYIRQQMSVQTIGHNKLNQLMHAKFLPSIGAIKLHMKKHASIIAPKFKRADELLTEELDGLNIAEWNKPNGGYFISLDVYEGCAKEIVDLCKKTGVTLTGAGATYPYKKDPKDSNIRIAPTFPPLEELEEAIVILTICIKVVVIEHLLKSLSTYEENNKVV